MEKNRTKVIIVSLTAALVLLFGIGTYLWIALQDSEERNEEQREPHKEQCGTRFHGVKIAFFFYSSRV